MKGKNCRIEDIQRLFQYGTKKTLMNGGKKKNKDYDYDDEEEYLENVEERIFFTVRDVLMGQGCVFFGAYANRMYLKTLKYLSRKNIPRVPDFDVLSDDPETASRLQSKAVQTVWISWCLRTNGRWVLGCSGK